MSPYRLIAAAASIVTALVLQASVLSPVTAPWDVSLPAILVATIGLQGGVSAGMSVGFAAGLLADLCSRHPAGVLALCWLVLGIGCGLLAEPRRRLRWSVLIVGLAAGLAGLVATAALDLLGAVGADLPSAVLLTGPSSLADAVLALAVIGPTRAVLRAHRVRDEARRVRWARAPSISAGYEQVAVPRSADPATVRRRGAGRCAAPVRPAEVLADG